MRKKAKERRTTREEREREREGETEGNKHNGIRKQKRTAGTREYSRRKLNCQERGEKRKKSKGGKARTRRELKETNLQQGPHQ